MLERRARRPDQPRSRHGATERALLELLVPFVRLCTPPGSACRGRPGSDPGVFCTFTFQCVAPRREPWPGPVPFVAHRVHETLPRQRMGQGPNSKTGRRPLSLSNSTRKRRKAGTPLNPRMGFPRRSCTIGAGRSPCWIAPSSGLEKKWHKAFA